MPRRPLKESDRKLLIDKIKAVSRRLRQRYVSKPQFLRLTGINGYQVLKYFDSYNGLLKAAGLELYQRSQRIPEDELLREVGRTLRKARGMVSRPRFAKLCRYSFHTYTNRWGSWTNLLRAFRAWQEENDKSFPYAEQIDAFHAGRPAAGQPRASWAPLGGRQYGDALNFRGLLHNPVNEMGVVFMFATLAADLGFLIESLTAGFPDCEAKRRVGKLWERVRIEFEFQSRNFRDHRHDPRGCDLIVCWENNWPQCPIEVLELKVVVGKLRNIQIN